MSKRLFERNKKKSEIKGKERRNEEDLKNKTIERYKYNFKKNGAYQFIEIT